MTARKVTIATMEGPATEPPSGVVDTLCWWLIQRLKGPARPGPDRQRELELREPEAGL